MNTVDDAQKRDQDWTYANKAMAWYGWGSPIGVGLFLVSVAATLALLRYAFWG
ncbi:MAG: hypothetical protein WD036_05940 [Bauldia sp.]